jgi:hypothetical protein
LPLWVDDGCQGGLGHDLVEPTVLLGDVLFANLAVFFLVIALCHVVLAPAPSVYLDLLLMHFPILGRGLFLIPVLLLLFLVGIVFLVLLFLVIASTLFLVSSFVIFLDSCGLLEVRRELELVFESSELGLHCHNLVFVWELCPSCSFLLQQIELVGYQQDKFLLGEGKGAISVDACLRLM